MKFHPRNKLKSAHFLAKKRAEISSFSSQENELKSIDFSQENELKTVDYLAQNNELKLEEFLTRKRVKIS